MPEKKYIQMRGINPFSLQTKILWHHDRLFNFLNKGSSFPVEIEINPTNYCNEKCVWCISSYSHKKEEGIDKDVLLRFIEEYKEMGGKSIIWSGGGEPTCYPHLKEAILKAAKLGIKQGLMTNGFFNEDLIPILGKHMGWVRFSLDTADKERYKKMKGVDAFDTVVKNIKLLTKTPVRVVTNMNMAEWNVDEIEKMAEFSKEIGADGFQIRPILGRPYGDSYNKQSDKEFILKQWKRLQDLDKFKEEKFKVFISWDKFHDVIDEENNHGRIYNKCQYHHFIAVLNSNGEFTVCMYRLNDPKFVFGNVNEKSLKEIWNSDKRKEVIDHCDNKIDFSKCQVCCKGHELNKFLHRIQNPIKSSDPDFL